MKKLVPLFITSLLLITPYHHLFAWDDIFEASMFGKPNELKKHINNGISIDKLNKDGSTPLILAVLSSNNATAKFLIENNANVNIKNSDKENALMGTCISKNITIAKLLLSKGADFNTKNIDGASAMDLCIALSPEILPFMKK